MARLTSISGRQCPTGCADEEDLARAPNIFVIGMSRPKDRTTVDVLHLEDEVAKRKDRERGTTLIWRLGDHRDACTRLQQEVVGAILLSWSQRRESLSALGTPQSGVFVVI